MNDWVDDLQEEIHKLKAQLKRLRAKNKKLREENVALKLNQVTVHPGLTLNQIKERYFPNGDFEKLEPVVSTVTVPTVHKPVWEWTPPGSTGSQDRSRG